MARTIYEKCWKKEKCIRILGRRACASATACIKIFEEGGVHKIELRVGNHKVVYNLLDTCYPAVEAGIARLNVCTRDIRISGGRLRSVKLTADFCIGTKLLGRRVEKCWNLIGATVPFAYLPLSDLKSALEEEFSLDSSMKESLDLTEDEVVAVALDDDDHADGILKGLWGARLVNNYPKAVQCWTGEPTSSIGGNHFFDVAGDGGVSPEDIDVDHVKDPNGQWWKCGEDLTGRRTVFVERSGDVRNAECKTSGPNKPCGQ